MKYSEEMYIDSQIFSGDMDGSESCFSEKIVKTMKPHDCCVCEKEIKKGTPVRELRTKQLCSLDYMFDSEMFFCSLRSIIYDKLPNNSRIGFGIRYRTARRDHLIDLCQENKPGSHEIGGRYFFCPADIIRDW